MGEPPERGHIRVRSSKGAAVFPNAYHWQVSQLNIVNTERRIRKSDLTTILNPIFNASHTRNLKTSPPNSDCFPGTRLDVIADINTWAPSDLTEEPRHILWVYGYAGCGKSAIAQAVAVQLAQQRQLGASFFFFRGAGDRGRISRFAATIASQLLKTTHGTARYIKAALNAYPGLLEPTTSPMVQFERLVYAPLKSATAPKWYRLFKPRKPIVIVVDGLDECEDREDVADFIKGLITFFDENPEVPVRFLITSRVEDHLHRRLHKDGQVCLLNLVDHTSDDDIATALDSAIQDASGGRVLDACGQGWLTPEDKRQLIEHIQGSFIFMTTIVKLLFAPPDTDGLTPAARLPLVLNMNPGCDESGPRFDDLYVSILRGSQPFPHFSAILSTIALAYDSLSIAQIADLLEIKIPDVVVILVNLHAIMQVPGDDHSPVTIWHASLRDFLTSKHRAGPFYASSRHHRRLAYRIITLNTPLPRISPSPASYYAWAYVTAHWREYVASTKFDVSTLIHELDRMLTHLERTFPTDFHDIVATYFHLDRWTYYTLSRRMHSRNTPTLLDDLCPRAPARDTGKAASTIAVVIDTIMSNPGEAPFRKHLLLYMQESRPWLFNAARHLEIVLRGIPLLVTSRGPDAALGGEDVQYMLICWSLHLASAIQATLRHPAFDRTKPTRFAVGSPSYPSYDSDLMEEEDLVEATRSNLSLAEQTTKTIVGSKPLRNLRAWDWEEYGGPLVLKKTSSVTVFDVLNGLCLRFSCSQSACAHPKTSGGKCRPYLAYSERPPTIIIPPQYQPPEIVPGPNTSSAPLAALKRLIRWRARP